MERIGSLFSPTITAALIEKYFEYPVTGEAVYSTPGTYTWTCPEKVYSVSVLCIGGGGAGSKISTAAPGGGGGALAYLNNYSVVPGVTYTVVVGDGGQSMSSLAGNSYFAATNIVFAERGQHGGAGVQGARDPYTVAGEPQYGYGGKIYIGTGGGAGGDGGTARNSAGSGGGGAGGYTGSGGDGGGFTVSSATTGSGGGGGGGGWANTLASSQAQTGGGGGGVGIYGQGTNGTAGNINAGRVSSPVREGGPGSNGVNTYVYTTQTLGINPSGAESAFYTINYGGLYGGGGGGLAGTSTNATAGKGGPGVVRIVWPGSMRSFPSSNVAQRTVTQTLSIANTQMGVPVNIRPIIVTGAVGTLVYSISPPIPSNTSLTFSSSTGTISGTPSNGWPETVHTITTIDDGGQTTSNTFIFSIGANSGQITFAGNYGLSSDLSTTWTVPANVYSISVIAVGAGGSSLSSTNTAHFSGGGGGSTVFADNIRVEPGEVFSISVGSPIRGTSARPNSAILVNQTGNFRRVEAQAGQNSNQYNGGAGGDPQQGDFGYSGGSGSGSGSPQSTKYGGGGAGGYAGNGGAGGSSSGSGSAGTGGAGGGGAGTNSTNTTTKAGGGGGVNINGQGTSGAGGVWSSGVSGAHGYTGSNNRAPALTNLGGTQVQGGSDYGGGAGGGPITIDGITGVANGGSFGGRGAIRIIWPGTLRRFDANTRTTNE